MKKLITYLFIASSASMYAADISLVDLDSSNASNSSVDTYYKWNVDPDSIAMDATINFTESNLGLFANRGVRDFKGTINLAADTSGNIMAVGNTTQNVLGFGRASIVGENTNTSFTITAYHGDEYQTGYYRFTSATALSIYKATVTFTDTDIAYTGSASSGKTSTIAVEEGGTIVWNIGGLQNRNDSARRVGIFHLQECGDVFAFLNGVFDCRGVQRQHHFRTAVRIQRVAACVGE